MARVKNGAVTKARHKKVLKEEQDVKEMIPLEKDAEMKALMEEELYACKERLQKISEELRILLLPKDPNDDKNVIMEIRGGAGGEEASLFAFELYVTKITQYNF